LSRRGEGALIVLVKSVLYNLADTTALHLSFCKLAFGSGSRT
jgi:hypothetical protein